jgi:L-xylulokinase
MRSMPGGGWCGDAPSHRPTSALRREPAHWTPAMAGPCSEVGCRPWPGQPSMVAAQLLAAEVARGEVAHLLFAKDYLGMLLTGEIATDASDASTAGLLSLGQATWSTAACEAAGLPRLAQALPPLVPSGSLLGGLAPGRADECGLPRGLPVAVGAIDLLASLEAVGAVQTGQAAAVLGTWCVNAVVGPALAPLPQVGAVVRFGPAQQRLYLENSPSSMANASWLARLLGLPGAASVVDLAFSVPLGADGLRFLPFIHGAGDPAGATAGFIGLQAHHGPAHLARAVVDAVAAWHVRHLKRLAAAGLGAGVPAALGGGARDERLVRLIAAFLGCPVQRCGDDETGARGAALYAARARGQVIPAAPMQLVEPDAADAAAHPDFYGEFQALVGSLAPAWARQAGCNA